MTMDGKGCKLSASAYGHTMEWRSEFDDCGMEEFLDAFYGCMIGLTFPPKTVLSAMKEYADERLPLMETDGDRQDI